MTVPSAAVLALSQLAVSVSADTTVAELPRRAGADEGYAVVQALQSRAQVELPGKRWQLEGAYTPRASFRLAPQADLTPQFLHQLELAGSIRRGRNSFSGNASLSLGQIDFITSNQVFGFQDAALPADPQIFIATSETGIAYARSLTKRLSLQISATATDQRPLRESRAVLLAFRPASSLGLQAGTGYRLTERDELSLSTGPRVSFFERRTYLENRVTLGFSHQYNETFSSAYSFGVGRSQLIDVDQSGQGPTYASELTRRPSHFVVASASVTRARTRGSESLTLVADANPNPVLQTVRPQASLSLTSNHSLDRKIQVSGSVGFVTTANLTPLPSDPNETGVSARLGAGSSFGDLSVQVGGAYQGRGPHLVRGFDIRERVLSAFVGLTWSLL